MNPTALGFVLKERIFREYEPTLDLDIFVVNTYTAIGGLLCQTVFFVPLAALSGVPFSDLSRYMMDAYRCFTNDVHNGSPNSNSNSDIDDYDETCRGSPLAPVLYLAMNVLYNIFFLMSIKYGGTLLTFITNTVTFPLSTLLFTSGIPWPLLGPSVRLNGWILVGLVVEVTGILWYYSEKTKANIFFCCCFAPFYGRVKEEEDDDDDDQVEKKFLLDNNQQQADKNKIAAGSGKNHDYSSIVDSR